METSFGSDDFVGDSAWNSEVYGNDNIKIKEKPETVALITMMTSATMTTTMTTTNTTTHKSINFTVTDDGAYFIADVKNGALLISFPRIYEQVTAALGFVNVDLIPALGLECLARFNYISTMLLTTLGPIVVCLLLWLQ